MKDHLAIDIENMRAVMALCAVALYALAEIAE